MAKKRLDQLILDKGLAASRERAQALILAGKILVDDTPQSKPGSKFDEEKVHIRVRGEDHPFVSRGGLKLQAALDQFKIGVAGKTALDIGASTGGFCHVLLLRGMSKVYAVDVGQGQLDWKIRTDPRVVVKEKINARYLQFGQIGEKVDLITVDVSFISLEKILPALTQFATPDTEWITLIKPQFEVGRKKVGKGGIVTSEQDRREAVDRIVQFADTLGLTLKGLIESPITGVDGNKEYLAHWRYSLR